MLPSNIFLQEISSGIKENFRHFFVTGGSGSGKTTLINNITQLMAQKTGNSLEICIIDPKENSFIDSIDDLSTMFQ